jgi:hypothetical protein
MSIVNDALKKAGKEFESNVGERHAFPLPASDKKWLVITNVSLVIIASLLGSLILYKNMPIFKSGYASTKSEKSDSVVQSALNNIEQKNIPKAMESQNVVKLNGIVYGDEEKWAIVNDNIVKEGDKFLDGEIAIITKELVKIKKNDGSEITLSLK